jgi:membrane-bound lytic murein transglycosylase A
MPARRGVTTTCLAAALALSVPAAAGPLIKIPHARLEPLTFAALTGWSKDDQAAAFDAFLKSCGAILHGTKATRAARPMYGALFDVCRRAVAAGPLDRVAARRFFEDRFTPVKIVPDGGADGFFTGYWDTEIEGSRVRSAKYPVPLYGVPKKFAGRSTVFSQYDRAAIEDGALAGKDLEICWVKDPVDAFFAQIQGSTRIILGDGKVLRLNYIASNGQPYTPVGKFLIERNIIPRDQMSMDRIRAWMEANPEAAKQLRRKNRSFVFFKQMELKPQDEIIGAQGVPLTALRSLAVDRHIHVYGTPIWINAQLPLRNEKTFTPFQHLMMAQDTGSAIVGPARADIYFGHGEEVGHIAGRLRQHGEFVMLVPKGVTPEPNVTPRVPIPKPRPKQRR